MDGTWKDDGIYLDGDARQRFHDARGYGELSDDGRLRLDPIEAAHLLYRGDIDRVEGMAFPAFLRSFDRTNALTEFVVYADFRGRGYYLRPARNGSATTFIVYERGSGPPDGTVAYRVRVIDERSRVSVGSLTPSVLAFVDEEAEVGYVEINRVPPEGTAESPSGHAIPADILGQRVVVWEPPTELYTRTFFGQPLGGRTAFEDPLQLSLVEAWYLADRGVIDLDSDRVRQTGRVIEGDRFDRRLMVYRALREAGTVPKTGYKFGADFRVYRSFESLDAMGHSDQLVRVVDPGTEITSQSIALDVRLAHGVGKRMVFARGAGSDYRSIDWLSIERLTP